MSWASSMLCAAIFAAAMPAAAETMASPPIVGDFSQKFAVCYVFNSGTTAISISNIQICGSDGVCMNTQGKCLSLKSYGTCSGIASIVNGKLFSCRVTLTGKANARGSIEIRAADTTVQNRADLR